MLKQELEKVKKEVDPLINDFLKKNHDDFKELITYQINTGGKRVRPFLLTQFYLGLGGGDSDKVLKLGAAVEIFHNYTLLIDDIIDHGEFRRGEETNWKKWGASATMCISSFYFSTILDLLKDFEARETELFSKFSKSVMEGEIIDILQERGHTRKDNFYRKYRYKEVTFADYQEMVNKKTAALFELSCGLGASLAKSEVEEALQFGKLLGTSYQIKDDLLDIFGEEKKFGKEIGKDIKERKGGNLVLLFAQEEDRRLIKILNKKEIKEKDVKKAIKLINNTDAQKRAEEMLDKKTKEALEALNFFPKNKQFKLIKDLLKFIKKRNK
jgi:geranylgeranyl diphosphate synthase type I